MIVHPGTVESAGPGARAVPTWTNVEGLCLGRRVEPEQEFTDAPGITAALDAIFDCVLVFHGFADFMRDYDLVVYVPSNLASGTVPRHLRYRFTNCVRASVVSALSRDTWAISLDDGLVEFETGTELDGFVWGVKWEDLYPGAKLVESADANGWTSDLGVPFHEVQIETNVHTIALVFSALRVCTAAEGDAPFVVPGSREA